MGTILNEIEVRLLGSLMEKALSTPDYYPLSLNALTNACNQKSSRDPVDEYAKEISNVHWIRPQQGFVIMIKRV